jgi:hypothetical protein
MTRENFSDSTGKSFTGKGFDSYRMAVQNIIKGNSIDTATIVSAAADLVDQVSSGRGTFNSEESAALEILFDKCDSIDAKARIIGKLIAAGTASKPVFDNFSKDKNALILFFDQKEIQDIEAHLSEPIEARLGVLTSILDKHGSNENSQPGDNRMPGAESEEQNATLSSSSRRRKESADKKMTDSDPDALKAAIVNSALPEMQRFAACKALGKESIPLLSGMILKGGSKNERDREFAKVALIQLSFDTDTGLTREIFKSLQNISCYPELSADSEFLLRNINKYDAGSGQTNQVPSHANDEKSEPQKDGWMMRAIDTCDTPNILMSSIGRESITIPLVIKKIAELKKRG